MCPISTSDRVHLRPPEPYRATPDRVAEIISLYRVRLISCFSLAYQDLPFRLTVVGTLRIFQCINKDPIFPCHTQPF